ncbi:hypothetical protein [Bythopirellula polymerisocia]|uniref:hypothetical protein n=1 Tax=Bythopirellula polymerisocia TaxID=2528003 RepID=UPI0011B52F1B|nr:hypothetical protein [Bythopirellula polymerisocia]
MYDGTTNHTRIWLLVVIHLLFGIAPLAEFLFDGTIWFSPADFALGSLSIAQIMLLSFWVGMGGSKWIVRVLGAIVGTAYVTLWPVLSPYMSFPVEEYESSFSQSFVSLFASYSAIILLLTSVFALIRRRGTKLIHLSQLNVDILPARVRYSTFHLLILMSICSFVLSLAKLAQPPEEPTTGFSTFRIVALFLLMLVVFLINNLCAAWATLSLNSPWTRIALVLGNALLLGISFAIATGNYSFSWQMFIGVSLIPVLSTAIVIVSLLVIRSCHYRIVPSGLLQAAS